MRSKIGRSFASLPGWMKRTHAGLSARWAAKSGWFSRFCEAGPWRAQFVRIALSRSNSRRSMFGFTFRTSLAACCFWPRRPPFFRLRSGHQLFQRPSRQRQIPATRCRVPSIQRRALSEHRTSPAGINLLEFDVHPVERILRKVEFKEKPGTGIHPPDTPGFSPLRTSARRKPPPHCPTILVHGPTQDIPPRRLPAYLDPAHAQSKLAASQVGSRIDVTIDGKFFTSYRFAADEKYPFFFPVNGPSGASVTSMRNGEYPHHSSLFFGCDKVNGGNYWQEGLDRGRIVSQGPGARGRVRKRDRHPRHVRLDAPRSAAAVARHPPHRDQRPVAGAAAD